MLHGECEASLLHVGPYLKKKEKRRKERRDGEREERRKEKKMKAITALRR